MLQPQQPPPGLSPLQRLHWNNFIDYLDKQGVKGSPLLDQRDKNLGQFYFQKYASTNPGLSITYNDVPKIQQELQDYRTNLVNQWKSGKAKIDSIKTEDEIMPNLSPADGWLGSKTSSYKYPNYVQTDTKAGNTTTNNYGTTKFDEIAAQLKNK